MTRFVVLLLSTLVVMGAARSEPEAHGGWLPGDTFVYSSGCSTEAAIIAAAQFFAQSGPSRPFVNINCFSTRVSIPMRLVRPIGEYPTVNGQTIFVWEIVDIMRETEFTLLPARDQVVPSALDGAI